MKIRAKQYAQALFTEIKKGNKEDISKIIFNFVNVLREDNCLSQIEKIISYFNNFWKKEHSLVEAEITTSRQLNDLLKQDIIKYLMNLSKSEKIKITEKEDVKIVGGFIIRYNDKIIDASIKNKIKEFKHNLIQ